MSEPADRGLDPPNQNAFTSGLAMGSASNQGESPVTKPVTWKTLTHDFQKYAPVTRRSAIEPVEMSFGQRRLWFVSQLGLASVAYNAPMGWRLRGRIHVRALEWSLGEIIRRHEGLRTCFPLKDGQPVQVVSSQYSFILPVIDLEMTWPALRDAQLQQAIQKEIQRPFDLSGDLMLRAALFRVSEEEHVLVLTVHHIACDGQSVGVILRELPQFYSALVGGFTPDVPEPLVQCGDVTLWARENLTEELQKKQLAFWVEQLKGAPSVLELPCDHPRPETSSFRGGMEYRRLSKELTQQFKLLTRRHGVTSFMALLAVLDVLLFRLSGQEQIIVGASVTNRSRAEMNGSIGYFSNMLPLLGDLRDDPAFRELLKRVRGVMLGADAHRDVPFETIVAELQPERTPGRNPLIQVILNLEDISWHDLPLAGLESSPVALHQETARFDLNLSVIDDPDGFDLALEYNSDIFHGETVQRLLGHYETLLRAVVADPECRVSRLPWLTESEREEMLLRSAPIEENYPRDACVHDLFEAQVERTPRAIAVEFREESLRYRDLNARANQLAHYLVKRGVGPEVLVGICLDRCPSMLIAILAVLKAGGAYVPLDPSHPAQWRTDILAESDVRILITQDKFMGEMSPTGPMESIPLDTTWPIIATESEANPSPAARANNLVYIMHTSGSTGRPKGVQMEHRNVVNFLCAMQKHPGMSADDVVLAITTITFDPSVLELILPLTVGARIVIVAREDVMDAQRLREVVTQSKPSVMQATPTSWKMLLGAGWEGSPRLKALCGGEVLSRGLADQLLPRCASLWNIYGPTETTVWSFVHEVNAADRGVIPIGRAIPNVLAFVLDSWAQPVPIGVAGELYVGGDGVGRGYLGSKELTAQKFVVSPFQESGDSRLYRSGDLVRRRHDGSLEFVDRVDRQIKIRGNRVEPGEIESALGKHPNVDQVAVVAREDESGDHRLVAYIVPRNGPLVVDEVDEAGPDDPALCMASDNQGQPPGLRSFIRGKLPQYMIPAAYVAVDALPRTATGKLDWRALPDPDFRSPEVAFVSPRDAVEFRLAKIWEETLKVSRVGATDDFFDLGGHSVLATELFARLEKVFGKRLALSALFQAPTLEQMAAMLREERSVSPWLVEVQPGDPSRLPFFFVQERMGYRHLGAELGPEQPVYVVRYDNLHKDRTERSLRDIAAELAEKVREVQPHGPYFLGGTCLAGWVAFSIASELLRQGEDVELLAIFDSFAPAYILERSSSVRWRRLAGHLKWHVSNLVHADNQQRFTYLSDRMRTLRWHLKTSLWWRAHSLYVRTGRPLPAALRQNAWLIAKAALTAGPPDPYPGRIVLFRPRERPKGPLDDPYLGWKSISQQIELYEVPGDHKHLLLPPNVSSIGQQLRACLLSKPSQVREAVPA
jgi:amino acid adenylation domain-containing protein